MGLKSFSPSSSSGLAALLTPTKVTDGMLISNSLQPEHRDPLSAVAYILDEPDVAGLAGICAGLSLDFDAVSSALEGRLAVVAVEAADVPPPLESAFSGRVGPLDVTMLEVRGSCTINNGAILSRANFSSVRANVAVHKGRWMYEVQLGSSGILQIGWTAPSARFTAEEGVGDSAHSYAYDGKRQRKWNVAAAPYGDRWTAGDVISCAIDMDAGTISYWRNGKALGVAFRHLRRRVTGAAYLAGISLSYAERCEVNFGERPFAYPQEGYQPLQAPPPPTELAAANYLTGCWERLVEVSLRKSLHQPESPETAAAAAAAAAAVSTAFTEEGNAPALPPSSSANTTHAGPLLSTAAAAAEGGGAGQPTPAAGSLQHPTPPLSHPWAAEDIAGLRSHRLEDANDVTSSPEATAASPLRVAGPLSDIEAVLLAAVLAPYCRALCTREYLAESTLLQLLQELLDWAEDAAFDRLLRLLCAALEPHELALLAGVLAASLGRKIRACEWEKEALPDSSARFHLAVWARCMRHEQWATAWLSRPSWCEELEGLLAVRQVPADDLTLVLPNLQWEEGAEYSAVLAGSTGGGEFAADVEALAAGFRAVEEVQTEVLAALCCAQDSAAALSLPEGAVDPFAGAEPPPALAHFLGWLVRKNQGAGRNVPPPGLTPRPVMASTFFSMLRLLRPWFDAVHICGAALTASAASFYRGWGGDEVGASLTRLGGTLSHLLKEQPPHTANTTTEVLHIPAAAPRTPWLAEWPDAAVEIPLQTPSTPESPLPDADSASNSTPLGAIAGLELDTPHAWHWWLINELLTVYNFGVAALVRLGFTHLNTLEQALSSLHQMSERMHEERTPAGRELLRLSIAECKKTVADSLRQYAWHSAWLLPGWKQEISLAMAAVIARVLTHVAALEGPLLGYVPELYLEGLLDLMHSSRRCEGRIWKAAPEMDAFGLGTALSLIITLTDDTRIVNPEARSMLLQTLWACLSEDECLGLMAANTDAQRHLLPALIHLLGDQRSWVQAANALGLLVQGTGMGHLLIHPAPPDAEAALVVEAEKAAAEAARAKEQIRGWLGPALRADHSLSSRFFNSLFDHVNWAVTELVVVLEELDALGSSEQRGAAQLHRRGVATADLCMVLLRLQELACDVVPEQILGKGRSMNATRLAEIVAFGLRQLAPAGKLDEILKRKGVAPARNRPVYDRRLRSTLALELLCAYLGAIHSLELHYSDKISTIPADPQLAHSSLVPALLQQGLPSDTFEHAVDAVATELDYDKVTASAMASAAASQGLRPEGDDVSRYRLYDEPPIDIWDELYDISQALEEGGSGGEGDSDGSSAEGEEEPPAELLDPIMQTIMEDPVVLPNSGVTVDRSTIERHLLSSATDPFSRAPLKLEEVRRDVALLARIEAWEAAKKQRKYEMGEEEEEEEEDWSEGEWETDDGEDEEQ